MTQTERLSSYPEKSESCLSGRENRVKKDEDSKDTDEKKEY